MCGPFPCLLVLAAGNDRAFAERSLANRRLADRSLAHHRSGGGAFTYMSAAAATPARPKIATVARTMVFMRDPPKGLVVRIRFVSNNKLTLMPSSN